MEETAVLDSKEFKKMCKAILKKNGFKRRNDNNFFLAGNQNILCDVNLQHSKWGAYYYINCYFYLMDHHQDQMWVIGNPDISTDRMKIMSRGNNVDIKTKKHFFTDAICYEEYSMEELAEAFEEYLRTIAIPPVMKGVEYMRENAYRLTEDGKWIGRYNL